MLRSTRFCLKFFTVAYAVAIPQGVFADAATNDSSERIEKRWTSSPVDHWQTYSQSGSNGIHKFIESEHSYKIKKSAHPRKNFELVMPSFTRDRYILKIEEIISATKKTGSAVIQL